MVEKKNLIIPSPLPVRRRPTVPTEAAAAAPVAGRLGRDAVEIGVQEPAERISNTFRNKLVKKFQCFVQLGANKSNRTIKHSPHNKVDYPTHYIPLMHTYVELQHQLHMTPLITVKFMETSTMRQTEILR